MIRKQLYLDEDLDRALKHLAAVTGRSEASIVREAVRAYLDEHAPAPTEDPLARLVGLVAEERGPRDVAERHDAYLYEAADDPGRYAG